MRLPLHGYIVGQESGAASPVPLHGLIEGGYSFSAVSISLAIANTIALAIIQLSVVR